VLLSATLEWPERAVSVVLRDLSEHGALVETPEPIKAESRLYFCRKDLRVPGRVAWVSGRFAGIAFARPLKAEVVLRYINRPVAKPLEADLYRRPGFNRSGAIEPPRRPGSFFGRRSSK
jgi:hypothetical protein